MAKVSLKATGGLNKDVDLNLLPEGDYSNATNIIFDSGKTGGAGAIKMLESITTAGFNFGSDTIKDTFQAADGQIYVLTVNGATAYIYRIPITLDSKVTILSYTHSVSVDFDPDIKVLDNCIIWNYHATGTPLLFSLDGWTTTVVNPAIGDLTLAKRTPNNVFTVEKNQGAADSGLEFLETRDFQFAGRYQYKSGEYSVLGAYSQMYKGADGVSSYTFTYSFTGAPTNAEFFELYTRIGNAGIWRRIDTAKIGTDTELSWTGQIYESLDTVTTAKPFDAVPVSAKHIEIAKNRVFLANIVDDYDVSSANLDFTISELAGSGYQPSTESGTHATYLTTSDLNLAEAGISSRESVSTAYYKPFANDSTYGIGLAYYDEAMKTRGVEKYIKFKTGKFAYPILPTIRVGLNAGWAKPSWARYAQLVYTKNISKSYIYEGFASNIFFELTSLTTDATTKAVTEITTISQSITADQFKNVKFMVVDLMGMFRAGYIYNFSADDRIAINTPNGLFDFKIDSQSDNFLYCKYDKGTMSNPVIPTSRNLYFEIYTPKQVPEDESLLFYEYGNLMDISSWAASTNKDISGAGTLNTNKLIGDMVFSKIDLPVYSTAPFIYNTTKSNPAIYADDAVTVANIAFASTMQSSLTNPGTATDEFLIPTYTSFGANADEAVFINSSGVESATGPEVRISGFYDAGDQEAGNKLIINYYIKASWVLRFDNLIPPATPSGSMRWVLTSQIYRVPYNNTTNTYGSAVVYGTEVGISDRTVTTATEGNSIDEIITQELLLSANANISANDKFYVRLKLTLTASGDIQQALINIAKQTSASNGIVMTLNGDRIKPIVNTTYNANSIISGTTNKFVIRASSTATARPFWNISAGKPTVLISKNLNPTGRKNTIRYGGNYVAGTKINNLSSFFSLDSADVPIENGEIVSLQRASRLQGNGTMLLALCQNESAYLLLGEQELTQANNQGVLSISSNVIGTIRNLGYNYGLQDKQSSFNYKGNIWWWDNYNKKIIKYNDQGIELVSDTYMRSEFLTKSGNARFAFDPFYNMCFVSIGSETTSLGYSDTLKRWVSEYTFKTDFAESYGDKMVLFKSGVVYKSLQSGFNAFLGAAAVDSTIAFTLNSRLPIMPLNVSVTHDMNVMDYSQANGVKANLLSIAISNENGQASAINETNFIAEDNRLYAHILRDSKSQVRFETIKEQTFTATSGQTVFTITAGYTVANAIIDVYVNTVKLADDAYVATNGTTVVLNTGATVGDSVRIVNSVDKRLIEGNYIISYLTLFTVSLKDKTQNMRLNSLDIEVQSVSGHS
jgi:hypothetical protein